MIAIVCVHCSNALQVHGDQEEAAKLVGVRSSFQQDGYECFNCGKEATCLLAAEVSELARKALVVHDVTAQEAFAALNGMGIPSEATCCAEVLEAMFQSVGLKVNGRQMQKTNRYVVNSITFPNGDTVHLGGSSVGALAYRITKRHSYVRALEGERHVD